MSSPPHLVDSVELICHPQIPCRLVRTIKVALGCDAGGLRLVYRLTGELTKLRIPAPQPPAPAPAERLWAHTCFEAFIAAGAGSGYREWNFSPSSQWAEYAFSAYRERRAAEATAGTPPLLRAWRDARTLALEARIALCPPSSGKRAIGLSAVVEDVDGGLSYWALRHPARQPDFHHRDGFGLTLDLTTHSFSI